VSQRAGAGSGDPLVDDDDDRLYVAPWCGWLASWLANCLVSLLAGLLGCCGGLSLLVWNGASYGFCDASCFGVAPHSSRSRRRRSSFSPTHAFLEHICIDPDSIYYCRTGIPDSCLLLEGAVDLPPRTPNDSASPSDEETKTYEVVRMIERTRIVKQAFTTFNIGEGRHSLF
jgi:hypothetical protein